MNGLLLAALIAGLVQAQVKTKGIYWALLYGKEMLAPQALFSVEPQLDNRLLLLQALAEETGSHGAGDPGPPKFAQAVDMHLNSSTDGIWTAMPSLNIRMWRAQVTSPGAVSLSLLFDDFYLAPGSEFYVKTDQTLVGAFTPNLNNKADRKFAVAPMQGDAVTLQYVEPLRDGDKDARGRISLAKIVHGFRRPLGIDGTGAGASGRCNVDVACADNNHRDQIDAVGMMLTDSHQRYCSGVLLNNARRDGTQYFLTAKHCVRDDVSYYITGFNYEKQRCESGPFGGGRHKNIINPILDKSLNLGESSTKSLKTFEKSARLNSSCHASVSEKVIDLTMDLDNMLQPQTVQGFELVAEWDRTDFALLKIKERIPDHYNVFLAGYDASENQGRGTFVGIHHPMGDFKKISTYSGPVMKAAWIDDPEHLVHWQVLAWNRGTTERGSSGSPLLTEQGLSIGHLRGGFSSCENIMGSDFYGGLAWDWRGDGTPRHSLAPHLDPDNKGLRLLSGMRLNAARFLRHQQHHNHHHKEGVPLNATSSTEPLGLASKASADEEEMLLFARPIPKSFK